MNLKLDWCSHEAAKFACENWHYSKSIPVLPLVRIGVWEDNKFIGVVIFSRGANKSIGAPYGLSSTEVCELSRIALNHNHKVSVSKVMKISLIMLKKKEHGLKLAVSYADPEQGHIGQVYQAHGWVYAGMSSPSFIYTDKKGRDWHPRMVSASGIKKVFGKKRHVVISSQCERTKVQGKHRYLMPLDKITREKIKKLSKPYPKRAGSRDNAAVDFQSAEGGAIPTPALQNQQVANDNRT